MIAIRNFHATRNITPNFRCCSGVNKSSMNRKGKTEKSFSTLTYMMSYLVRIFLQVYEKLTHFLTI